MMQVFIVRCNKRVTAFVSLRLCCCLLSIERQRCAENAVHLHSSVSFEMFSYWLILTLALPADQRSSLKLTFLAPVADRRLETFFGPLLVCALRLS